MLISIFDPMGVQTDRLRCEVCQNLILSPMNTGLLRHAVATALTIYGIETDNGYKEEDIFKPRELEGITNLQKVLGKKGVAEYLEAYIGKPEGKPTLVPESDKRPAINTVETMMNEFKDEV